MINIILALMLVQPVFALNPNNVSSDKNLENEIAEVKKADKIKQEKKREYEMSEVKETVLKNKKYKKIENGFFSFELPCKYVWSKYSVGEKNRVYGIDFVIPGGGKIKPSTVIIEYYSKDNTSREKTYNDAINRIFKNHAGAENYEPGKVMRKQIAGRDGYEIVSLRDAVTDFYSPSAQKYREKRKTHIIPAKDGYYFVKFISEEKSYDKTVKTFDEIMKTFAGKF